MRYLIACERNDGECLSECVDSRAEAADAIAATCLLHRMLGGSATVLTQDASDPELHIDLYIGDERIGHLSAMPISDTLN